MHAILEEEGGPLDLRATFLDLVIGSVGTNMYRNVHVVRSEDVVNVTDDGDLSCAYYVSAVLRHFHLIQHGFYTTITHTLADMRRSGWEVCEKPAPGVVVVWVSKECTDGPHRHIGICLDETYCVSNSPIARTPQKHEILGLLDHAGGVRAVEMYYKHPRLEGG